MCRAASRLPCPEGWVAPALKMGYVAGAGPRGPACRRNLGEMAMSGSRLLQPITGRPHLMTAIAGGLVLYFLAAHWVTRDVTRALIGWNGGVLVFLGFSFFYMLGADTSCMKRRAIGHDEGRHIMLAITVLAAVASVVAL